MKNAQMNIPHLCFILFNLILYDNIFNYNYPKYKGHLQSFKLRKSENKIISIFNQKIKLYSNKFDIYNV